MKEILFRGKRVDNGEWVYGNYEYYHKPEKHIISDIYNKITKGVSPETIGQFIGLTDKNDTRIFEGDIVKFKDTSFGYSYIGFVCFHKGSNVIQYKFINQDKFHQIGKTTEWQDMHASGTITYEYEVIGNIHDNPELLKELQNERN